MLEAALELIDAEGLGALSMRRLGARLGVEAMAIYRHVPNKAALLDGVVELLLEQLTADIPAAGDWRAALRAMADGQRALERTHPHAYPLLARLPAQAYTSGRGLVERIVAEMVADGFDRDEAIRVIRAVARFAIGFSLTRPTGDEAATGAGAGPALGRVLDQLADPHEEDRVFAVGLDALLAGLSPVAATTHRRAAEP